MIHFEPAKREKLRGLTAELLAAVSECMAEARLEAKLARPPLKTFVPARTMIPVSEDQEP